MLTGNAKILKPDGEKPDEFESGISQVINWILIKVITLYFIITIFRLSLIIYIFFNNFSKYIRQSLNWR